MKKLTQLTAITTAISAAALLTISSSSFAAHANYKADYKSEAPCPPEVFLKDGFYLGIGLGYDAYKIRQSTSVSLPGRTATANPPLSAKGWNGSIFAGYGQYFDYFYIAGEILALGPDTQTTWGSGSTVAGQHNNKVNVHATYGISLLPGVRLNNTSLFYVRLGYLRTDFSNNQSGTIPSTGATYSSSNSEWKNGFNYGLGIETLVYDNVSVRGEYTYTQYGSSFGSNSITSYKPSNNQFVLGVLYHFA